MFTDTELYLEGAFATESRAFPIVPKDINEGNSSLPADMVKIDTREERFFNISKTEINPFIFPQKAITSADISTPSVEPLPKLSTEGLQSQPSFGRTESHIDKYNNISKDYLGMIRLRIEKHKKYPDYARERGIEGKVTIIFVLKHDGYISGVRIAKSSGYKVLDQAAITAVKNASPFPKPPNSSSEGSITLQVTITFELV